MWSKCGAGESFFLLHHFSNFARMPMLLCTEGWIITQYPRKKLNNKPSNANVSKAGHGGSSSSSWSLLKIKNTNEKSWKRIFIEEHFSSCLCRLRLFSQAVSKCGRVILSLTKFVDSPKGSVSKKLWLLKMSILCFIVRYHSIFIWESLSWWLGKVHQMSQQILKINFLPRP